MSHLVFQQILRRIGYLLSLQLGIILITALCLNHFSSLLMGGSISMMTTAYMIHQLLKYPGAKYAKQFVHHLYWTETLKIAFTVILFCMAFIFLHAQGPFLLLGYILAQSAYWLSPWIFNKTAPGVIP